jgi:uncharacterized protein YbjT (DUF2867 family)
LRILLTGATGFIGSHLLRALLEDRHEVICAVRQPQRQSVRDAAVRYMHADFTTDVQPAVWAPRLEGVDVVINAVGILREQGSQRFEDLHVRGPQALFLACEQVGVGCVIQISALGADEHANSRYHVSKKAADDLLAQLRLRWVILQASLVFGANGASARLFTTLASLPIIPLPGDGTQQVQPVHIDDVIATVLALLQSSECRRARIPIVGLAPMRFADFLLELRNALGLSRARFIRVPPALMNMGAALGSLLPGALLDRETLAMLQRGNTGPAGPMMSLLGRAPRDVRSFIPHDFAPAIASAAQLRWLLPLLRVSIAIVWIVTGLLSFGIYPVEESYALLARVGAPAGLAPLLLYGAAAFDLALGVGILFLRRRGWLWLLQITLILTYTIIISIKLPEFWLHPYGPILKNVPMLAAIWLLFELERRQRQ